MTNRSRSASGSQTRLAAGAEPHTDAARVLLEVRMLGGLELRRADGSSAVLLMRKAEALLALLALRPGEALGRDKICGLLWPEVRAAQARHNLRQTLLCLRKALSDAAPALLRADARAIALEPAHVRVDTDLLERRLDDGSPEALRAAAALYGGDLLEGLAIDSQPFEHWLTFERERLRARAADGLSRLVEALEAEGEIGPAISACAQLLRLDPLREHAHRRLMQLHVRQGRRAAALAHYRRFARALWQELGSAPEPETQQLFNALEDAARQPLSKEAAPAPARPARAEEGGDAIGERDTGLLRIAYLHGGRAGGPPVVLLHGWPDDATTFDGIAPALQRAGFRTFAPWLRGCGGTRFLSQATARSGEIAAMAQDVLDFADGLDLERFAVVGQGWGARIAYLLAAVVPQRVSRCAALALAWEPGAPAKPSFEQAKSFWYQWFMSTECGAELVRSRGKDFARFQWQSWSPPGWFDAASFDAVARSFENPDWAEVTLHAYRVRWGEAPPDPRYAELTARQLSAHTISVPTLMVQGGADRRVSSTGNEGREQLFTGSYERSVLAGVGHFPTREAPEAVSDLLLRFLDR